MEKLCEIVKLLHSIDDGDLQGLGHYNNNNNNNNQQHINNDNGNNNNNSNWYFIYVVFNFVLCILWTRLKE